MDEKLIVRTFLDEAFKPSAAELQQIAGEMYHNFADTVLKNRTWTKQPTDDVLIEMAEICRRVIVRSLRQRVN